MKALYKVLFSCLSAAVLCVGLSGCGSHKKTTAPVASEQPQAVTERSLENDFRLMTQSYTPWQSVSVPVKVRLTEPRRASLSGTLNMEYDKALELNLRMFFMDALTIYADNVSVIILSKPLDVYYITSMEDFTDRTGLDLRDLQSLLLGQVFKPGSGTATAESLDYFILTSDPGSTGGDIAMMDIRPRRTMPGVEWFFRSTVAAMDKEATPRLSMLDINVGQTHFQGVFDDYFQSAAGIVAGNLAISGQVKSHRIAASIVSDPGRAKWNNGVTAREPKIPEGMRRMTTEQIFKVLKQ